MGPIHERRLAHMFNYRNEEEQYIERENDYDNTQSNEYLANVYAQLSMSHAANDCTFVASHERDY